MRSFIQVSNIKHNNFIGLFNDFTIHELIYFIKTSNIARDDFK